MLHSCCTSITNSKVFAPSTVQATQHVTEKRVFGAYATDIVKGQIQTDARVHLYHMVCVAIACNSMCEATKQ